MKKLTKILKLILDRSLFIFIGLCLSISIFAVQAAWNSTVSTGQTLTTTLWNEMVAKLVELDGRNPVLSGAMCGMSVVGGVGLLSTCDGHNPAVSCPPGYTGRQFGESGPSSYHHWSCYKN